MSVASTFEKVKNKFGCDAAWFLLLNYFEAINEAIGSGGGGEVKAEDVTTTDESNVQAKIDNYDTVIPQAQQAIADNTTAIGDNTTAIGENTIAIADNTTAIASLEAGLQRGLISILDSTASVTISDTADTTYMTLQTKEWGLNDTTYYSFAGDTLTFLADGFYRIVVYVNAEKQGGGGSAGNLTVKAEISGTVPKNAIRILQIDNDGTIGASFTGIADLTANDTLRINFQNIGGGTLTASTTAEHDAFVLQIERVG